MPRGIKLLSRRRASKLTDAAADEDSETYLARLDRILDEPSAPATAASGPRPHGDARDAETVRSRG